MFDSGLPDRGFGRFALLLAVVLSLAGTSARAQIPKEFTNLQVLPKDVESGELVSMMRGFAGALGVRCNYCHLGGSSGSLEGMDFASDENPHKKVARTMMQMVQVINGEVLVKVQEPGHEAVQVKCMTCHRGQAVPRLTADVLEEAYEEGGLDALFAKYESLREEYYGTHTYDFSDQLLLGLADTRMRAGSLDDATALLEYNLKYNPDSAYTYAMLGQVHAQNDDDEAAIQAWEKSLQLEPDNDWVKRMLARIKG